MQVALTGATGFLGLRLVRELLKLHSALTVLTYAGSGHAIDRITRFFQLTEVPDEVTASFVKRIQVVEIDLTKPKLGLTEEGFQELANGLEVIWHCAGSINLEGDLASLREVNVEGTRRILELASAGRRRPMLNHISTAFVAGSRPDGVLYEDELDDSWGFENPYEQSKYEAESLVRAWSKENQRPVIVLRPSILVTAQPSHADLPGHPLQVVTAIAESIMRSQGIITEATSKNDLPVMRLVGSPDAHLNFMPVENAAANMVRLAEVAASAGVTTYHVVHHRDTAISDLIRVFEGAIHFNLKVVSQLPEDAKTWEKSVGFLRGFTPYLHHHRRFDDAKARAVLGPSTVDNQVDVQYLLAGIIPNLVGVSR